MRAVLLAGGASARMGEPKALLSFHGRPWIEAQLALFARAGGTRCVVVLSDHERHRAALPWLQDAVHGGARLGELTVHVVGQARPQDGPFSSLRLGLARERESAREPKREREPPLPLPGGGRGEAAEPIFIWPVDVPACASTFCALSEALGSHDAALPSFDGRRGHPVLLSARCAEALCARDGDARLDHELARACLVEVPVDTPTVLANLNTRADWDAWRASPEAARYYPAMP